ncbi:hypothetical protein [Saccharopolyspora hattusasensis]|uniref:hypothetical protein n=1 Tax=Saccharopolyspora hattusasensis TaxID=1128679 RepID=UPI003D99BDEE
MITELAVPADQEFLDQFGESPQRGEEPWIRYVTIPTGDGELHVSFDTAESSVRFDWYRGDDLIWHCYREQATTLQIETSEGETRLAATFESEDLKGQLNVRVYPHVGIHDSTLRG